MKILTLTNRFRGSGPWLFGPLLFEHGGRAHVGSTCGGGGLDASFGSRRCVAGALSTLLFGDSI